jgi:succinoglycan biosynthesis protein ExoO
MRFAVVIPLYNKRPHIERALDSVFAQTDAPAEIIVVDDASTDGSLEPVLRYRDPRMAVLRRSKPGPGGYAARNLAIHRAESDWIAFLDADDAWVPEHLATIRQTVAQSAQPDRVSGVFSGYANVYSESHAEADRYTRDVGRDTVRTLTFEEFLSAWLELKECPVWTSASAFRRQVLIDAGLFAARCRRGGDKDLWLRASRNGLIAASRGVTAIYHRDASNMVTRNNPTATRHCLCDTIQRMLPDVPNGARPLLKKLFNQEVYLYALHAVKDQTVSPESWRGFYAQHDPLRFIMLAGLSTHAGAFAARRLRSMLLRAKAYNRAGYNRARA